MPTYEYECGHCGRFQIAQRITEPALAVCPTCGQRVRRLISRNVGIIFKGSGFYCTDHRSNDNQDKTQEIKKPAEAAASKPEAKTEPVPGSCSTCPEAKKSDKAV